MSVSLAIAGRLRDEVPERNAGHAVFCYPEEANACAPSAPHQPDMPAAAFAAAA
jgi:hypothetical protein